MFVTMQGNWTVTVKAKAATPAQHFTITGATVGNGTYNEPVGFSVPVVGSQWTIGFQNDPGTGMVSSFARIKYPTVVGTNYVFDIESNENDTDSVFDNLVLSCSTPVTIEDYIIYGHVKSYVPPCLFNPCFGGWIVIDTQAQLDLALQNSAMRMALTQLYPDRIKPPIAINPNPPDPVKFTPMMINVSGTQQAPSKTAVVYDKQPLTPESAKKTPKTSKTPAENTTRIDAVTYNRDITLNPQSFDLSPNYTYDRVPLLQLLDSIPFFCPTQDVPSLNINFQEYDRTALELAGYPYTGLGLTDDIGFTITDMNGNYIFHYTQTMAEIVSEISSDVPNLGNALVEVRPDIIASILDPSSNAVNFATAPHYNIPNLKQIDFCLPASVLPNTQVCLTTGANLIEYIGDIAILGSQNINFIPAARGTAPDLNILTVDGKITAHDPTGPHNLDCACWVNPMDLRGCMNSAQVIWYTIRYSRTPSIPGSWHYVQEEYHHQRVSNTDTYDIGTKVGPFLHLLNVRDADGSVTADPNAYAYMNIQKQNQFDSADWFPANIDILVQLKSGIYQSSPPGPVYFMVDTYNNAGNRVTSDMITLFIDNSPVESIIQDAYFTSIVADDCIIYNLNNAQINAPFPLKVDFKVHQAQGFLNEYVLRVRKGNNGYIWNPTIPPVIYGETHGIYTPAADYSCHNFSGTINVFNQPGIVTTQITPLDPWLAADQLFCTFAVSLSCSKRCTNGYSGYQPCCGQLYLFGLRRS